MVLRRALFALALAVLALALLAVYPALAHHKPGHHRGPAPTTSSTTTTTTTGAMPTTTVTLGVPDIAAAHYGPYSDYTQPAGSTSVAVGNLNQALLDGAATNTVFWLQAGIHRPAAEIGTMLTPKSGQQFHGAPGAILSGSVVLTGWTSDGSGHWFVDGQTQRGVDGTELFLGNPVSPSDFPRAWKSESVYIDNVIQKHQNALVDVGAGEWFFDYAANRIYIGTDPAGKTVETTIADRAIVGGGPNVVIRNLTIEKFMSPLQVATVDSSTQTGWQVIDAEVRWNHGLGLKISDGGTVTGSRVKEQGQLGVAGGGTGVTWEATEIVGNNTMLVDRGWEAGGSKFVFSTSMVVRGCWIHGNKGNGIWFDIQNRNPTIRGNLSEQNDWMGLFQEIGFGGWILNNTVRNNGLDYGSFAPTGGGIVVTTSTDVEVAYNTLVDNRGGGIWAIRDGRLTGSDGYELRNLWAHHNTVTMHSGLGGGTDSPSNGIQDFVDNGAYDAAHNNRFDNNAYTVTSLSSGFWYWQGGPKTWAQWQALPQDANGTAQVG